MLQLDKHMVRVTSASLNAENHGRDNHATGMTMKFKAIVSQTVLDVFSAALRVTLFRAQKAGDQLDLARENEGLVVVQYPKLKPFVWDEKFPGYSFAVGSPSIGLQEPISIDDATLKDVSFKALDGGSVELGFSLYFHPEESQFGPLARLMKEDAELSLTPPSAEKQQQLADLAA